MEQYIVRCPCCNQELTVSVPGGGNNLIAITSLDIEENAETTFIARAMGYEFGNSEKGGRNE